MYIPSAHARQEVEPLLDWIHPVGHFLHPELKLFAKLISPKNPLEQSWQLVVFSLGSSKG
jgi:hypothetical protein